VSLDLSGSREKALEGLDNSSRLVLPSSRALKNPEDSSW